MPYIGLIIWLCICYQARKIRRTGHIEDALHVTDAVIMFGQ